MTLSNLSQTKRNVWLFCAGTLLLSCLAGLLIAQSQGAPHAPPVAEHPAGLLFVVSPILVASLLRSLGGDGWHSAGLGLRARGNGALYALAVFAYPTLAGLTLWLGALTGQTAFEPNAAATFAQALAVGFVPRLVFALFEEFGWRGYLEAQLTALGVRPIPRHSLVAVIWGVWHLPYLAVVPSPGALPPAQHFPLFLIAVFPLAFLHGWLRERSGSVWPCVLMHGIANAIAHPLVTDGVVERTNVLLFAPRPESLVVFLGHALLVALLFRRRGPSAA